MEKVLVVFVNYNGMKDTVEAIQSVENSNYQADIIVVDNASLLNEAELLKEQFPKIQIIRSLENLGFSGGNNLGIKYGLENGYDYIILLNNDTVIDSEMIGTLVKNADSNTVAVPAMYYYSNPKRIWFGGGVLHLHKGYPKHLHEGEEVELPPVVDCTFATGCCWCVHRAIFQRIGFLNEEFFMYAEDTDFCIRLMRAGIKIKLISVAMLWHKVSMSSGVDSDFNIYYNTRNGLYCLAKNRDVFKWSAYPYSLFKLYKKIFINYLKGNSKWRAYYKGLRDFQHGVMGKVDSYI